MSDATSSTEDTDKTVVPTETRPGFASISAADRALPDADARSLAPSTLSERTGATSRTSPTGVTGTAGSTLGRSDSRLRTEADAVIANALHEEEGVRAHGFSAIIAAACALVSLAAPFLGGDRTARHLAQMALVVIFVGSLYVYRRTRTPRRYTYAVHRAYGLLIGTFVAFIEYYLGVFSPIAVALTLGVLFLGQSPDRIGGIVIPFYVIVRFAALASLVAFGVLPDRGLISAEGTDVTTRSFLIGAATMILAFTLRMARVSRASLDAAMKKAQEAILLAHERDAQLEEAKQNLDRALRAVVGRNGRYSGLAAGPFRLDEVIGVGAMGEVYAATSTRTGESVAVKLMQHETSEREDLVERFLREGEICIQLRSPHVVRVLEVGRMSDGSPYLAMERLHGSDLAGWLRRESHMQLDDAVVLAREMAEGLDEAHAAGVVHRDLKPQNLFRAELANETTAWKILDFGVSKLAGSSGTLTRAEVVGTPGYMSPEQARGQAVDARSDLFSMAVVLYRAVTGQPAFHGASVPEKLFEIVYRMPDAPTKLRAELPHDLDLVFAIALAKDPAHRFDSAGTFAKAFARAARGELPKAVRERGAACQRRAAWGTTVGAVSG